MSSKIILKNANGKELVINSGSALEDKQIQASDMAYTRTTIEDMMNIPSPSNNEVCVVTEEGRGGTFIYDSSKASTDNGGIIFNGWKRQYSGAINVRWFGAIGDGIADDTIPVHKLFSLLNSLEYNTVFVDGMFLVSNTINISTNYIKIKGYNNSKSGFILSNSIDSSNILFNVASQEVTFESLSIAGKGTINSGSQLFYCKNANGKADVDITIRKCVLKNTEEILYIDGRGVYIEDSMISSWVKGITLDYTSDLISGENVDQDLLTGFRSIRFINNRVHAGYNNFLFYNEGVNNLNIWGIHIADNYIDTDCGMWKGTLKEAIISNNKLFNSKNIIFYSSTDYFIKNVIISNNEFNGMTKNSVGEEKRIPFVISAYTVENLVFSCNFVARVSKDCISITGSTSYNIKISDNIFYDVLSDHRLDGAVGRCVLKFVTYGITGVIFQNNYITTSSLADALVIAGDSLVYSTGTLPNSIIKSNFYNSSIWKISNATATANKSSDYSTAIYDGDGESEKVISLGFYPSAVIINQITGTNAGATRIQLYGTSTGTTEVELRNGAVAVKDTFNTSGERYMLIAFQ